MQPALGASLQIHIKDKADEGGSQIRPDSEAGLPNPFPYHRPQEKDKKNQVAVENTLDQLFSPTTTKAQNTKDKTKCRSFKPSSSLP